jgi:hypothetical protein
MFDLHDQTIFIATDIENSTIINRISMWKDDFYVSDRSPHCLCRSAIPLVQGRFSVQMLFPEFAQFLLADNVQAATPFLETYSRKMRADRQPTLNFPSAAGF